jgi:DNA repair protein RecN (Recombination protein N)
MLVHLAIRDIVLIDKLELDLSQGLSVLTGETGAGKSILLDAFGLALGGRGDGGLVRAGQRQGQVTAVFDLAADHPARDILRASDVADERELILRRVQMADGRTRALINDQPVSAQVLRRVGAALVEIHGQHDARALVDPGSHRDLLDAFGGLLDLAADTAARYTAWRAATRALSEHRAQLDKARAERDFLEHAHTELTKLAVERGEEQALAERRTAMMHAEKIAVDLKEAYDALAGSDAPTPALAAIVRRLERRGGQAPALVGPAIAALDQALNQIEDARLELESALREADFEPAELERTEERLFALRAAGRKFDAQVDDLPDVMQRYADELASIDQSEGHLADLVRAEVAAGEAYQAAAADLSRLRGEAAATLDVSVNAELAPLRLERAQFTTQVRTDPGESGPNGFDRIEFWVRTNPGTKPGPMMKVASGGELSRFMLALKVALADRGSAPTLVFDEIDAGVGGAVADAIGVRLARLADRVQVVSVTHAPQVAARATTHFLISKNVEGSDRVATKVTLLDAARRREEIARMLAGARVTDEARAAADRLIHAAE